MPFKSRLVSHYIFLLFLVLSQFTLSESSAQSPPLINGPGTIGPELAIPSAGETVVGAQGYTGAVSVINYPRQGGFELYPHNPIPLNNRNHPVYLRVDIDAKTPKNWVTGYAEQLRQNGPEIFPGGIAAVILSVEANNLDPEFWNDPGIDLFTAGQNYAHMFNLFGDALGNAYPLAPAPPDLFNPVYSADPWMDGFVAGGGCRNTDVNVADIFELAPFVGNGIPWNEIHNYQEQKMCGAEVVHFEGWGIEPGTSPPPTVKEQVEWYANTPLPSDVPTATNLIIPHCPPKYEAKPPYDWWYYIDGRVFTKEGLEIDPETCELADLSICGYNQPYPKTKYPEHHSLRPYEHCPFDPTVRDTNYYLCGHDLIAKEKIELLSPFDTPEYTTEHDCGGPSENGTITCDYTVENRPINIGINLSSAVFPIMGLTEGDFVVNGLEGGIKPTDIQKTETAENNAVSYASLMNEYVSWYLNGSGIGRAEGIYPGFTDEDWRIVDFSGPLRKTLPWRIQVKQRNITIERSHQTNGAKLETREPYYPVNPTPDRHNQIAACITWAEGLGGLPFPCYNQDIGDLFGTIGKPLDLIGDIFSLIGLKGNVFTTPIRLNRWADDSDGQHEKNWENNWQSFSEKSPRLIGDSQKVNECKKLKTPPVPEEFDSYGQYWKCFQDWRGRTCTPNVLGIGIYLCFNDPTNLIKDEFYSTLFSSIPFTSTEDMSSNAELEIGLTSQPPSNLQNPSVVFVPNSEDNAISGKTHRLYFPHMEESDELGKLAQSTYVPYSDRTVWLGDELKEVDSQYFYGTNRCEIIDSRAPNPGDDLYGELEREYEDKDDLYLGGELQYSGNFTCTFTVLPDEACIAGCANDEACITTCPNKYSTCTLEAAGAISLYDAVPKVENIWQRFVDGNMSVFKRFYPKVSPNSPVSEIKDIPAESWINHSSNTPNTTVLAGDPGKNRSGENARIYFPHLGSVYDYFLQGIQTALRPKDINPPSGSSQIVDNENLLACYEEAQFQKYVAATDLSLLHPSLHQALSAAASAYDVPVCVLEAILTSEGSQMRLPLPEIANEGRRQQLRNSFAVATTSEWNHNDPLDVFNTQFSLDYNVPEFGSTAAEFLYEAAYCDLSGDGLSRGPFQITHSEWDRFHSSAKDKGYHSSSHIPHRCNFADSAFAAAALITEGILCTQPSYIEAGYCAPISLDNTGQLCAIGNSYYGTCNMTDATCRFGTNFCDYIRQYCGAPGDCRDQNYGYQMDPK